PVQGGDMFLFPQSSAFLPIYGPQVITQPQLKVTVVKMDVGGGQNSKIIGDGIGNKDFLPKIFIFLVHALDSEYCGPFAPLRIELKIVIEGAQFHVKRRAVAMSMIMLIFLFMFLPFLVVVVILELLSIVHGISKGCLKA